VSDSAAAHKPSKSLNLLAGAAMGVTCDVSKYAIPPWKVRSVAGMSSSDAVHQCGWNVQQCIRGAGSHQQ